MTFETIVKRVRVDDPDKFRLNDVDPADTLGLETDKNEAKRILADCVAKLAKRQKMLYAEGSWAILAVFQAMDAGGKDGVIEHVMSGINPQGCEVSSFKTPSAEELAHDFLWRTSLRLPRRGHIGVFNRSYYEEVLVVRVHPDMLERQNLPKDLAHEKIWEKRFEDIRGFERHLARNGTKTLKFHLRISKEEQRKRFLDRLQEPDKRWKFSQDDVAERKLWDKYMTAYDEMIRATSTREAPWHVIPADNKWTARLAVAAVMLDALERIDPKPPALPEDRLRELKTVEETLMAEAPRHPDWQSGNKPSRAAVSCYPLLPPAGHFR